MSDARRNDDDAEPIGDDPTEVGPERLRAALRALVGQPCWSASLGPRVSVALDLGEPLRRRQPLKNPQLSDLQRRFIGESWLLVQCAWRLDHDDRIVCASGDGAAASLSSLVGRTVTAFELRAPHDLALRFGALRLTLFGDRSGGDGDLYTLAIPGESLGVGATGVITCEPRAMPALPG